MSTTPTDPSVRLPGATPDLKELGYRAAIGEILALHSRGVDRAVEADLKACYWADATVAYGAFNGSAHEFCEMLPQAIRGFARTQHTISNTLIQFVDHCQRAAVESCVTAYHYRAADSGDDQEMVFIGRYLDRFERRGAMWKIRHRQVLMDWNQNLPASAVLSGPPFEGLAVGDRAPDDPLYAMLTELLTP